jgi:hypothetical protein
VDEGGGVGLEESIEAFFGCALVFAEPSFVQGNVEVVEVAIGRESDAEDCRTAILNALGASHTDATGTPGK